MTGGTARGSSSTTWRSAVGESRPLWECDRAKSSRALRELWRAEPRRSVRQIGPSLNYYCTLDYCVESTSSAAPRAYLYKAILSARLLYRTVITVRVCCMFSQKIEVHGSLMVCSGLVWSHIRGAAGNCLLLWMCLLFLIRLSLIISVGRTLSMYGTPWALGICVCAFVSCYWKLKIYEFSWVCITVCEKDGATQRLHEN